MYNQGAGTFIALTGITLYLLYQLFWGPVLSVQGQTTEPTFSSTSYVIPQIYLPLVSR
jgi:hypothetical protein